MIQNRGYSFSVLVVGDGHSPVLEKIRQSLEQEHFQVAVLEPVDGSLAAIQQGYFDLILLDGASAERNNSEIYRRLSTDHNLRDTPVIILDDRNSLAERLAGLLLPSPVSYLSSSDLLAGKLWPVLEHLHYMTGYDGSIHLTKAAP